MKGFCDVTCQFDAMPLVLSTSLRLPPLPIPNPTLFRMSIDDVQPSPTPLPPSTKVAATENTDSTATNPKPVTKLDFRLVSEQVYLLATSITNPIASPTLAALSIIEESIRRYGPNLALSFNGGKDCTVLLHLYVAALYRHLVREEGKDDPILPAIKAVYVTYPAPFAAVEEFVEDSVVRYGLDLVCIPGPMKSALQSYLDLNLAQGEKVDAILVGQRRRDPYSEHLRPFHPTDPTWPPFMRVHPIIDWTYQDIWLFLMEPSLTCSSPINGIPYCVLYNWGYTSLGSSHNTYPNPDLCRPGEQDVFEPAWRLQDEGRERCGRDVSQFQQQKDEPVTNGVSKEMEEKGGE